MYYAHFILNKKGPLAKIWLAAHWDKKLTKAQIYETNIESTIETILEPQMKLALRTSGHLLLGVCRIYSRKVKYLLADCNEAFVKIKLAFRPGLIDLPKEKQQASIEAITLPEKFPDFYVNFNDINLEDIDMSKNLAQQARVEDITLKEDFGTFVTMQEDDFGDLGSFGMGMDMDTFMMSDMEKGRRFGESLINNDQNEIDFFDDKLNNQSDFATGLQDLSKQNEKNVQNNDIEPMELTDELNPNPINSTTLNSNLENAHNEITQNDTMMPEFQENENNEMIITNVEQGVVPTLFDEQPTVNNTNLDEPVEKIAKLDEINEEEEEEEQNEKVENVDKTLTEAVETKSPEAEKQVEQVQEKQAPVVVEKQQKTRRRKKLIIDEVKEIDSATMKSQLSDTSAISSSLELAPPTRKLMNLKETGGVDKLFSSTSRPLRNKQLQKLYTRNMVAKSLADITNSSKLDKTLNQSIVVPNVTINHEASVEASMNDNQLSKNVLPLADSFIDNNNDVSKQNNLNEISLDNNHEQTVLEKLPNDLEDIENIGASSSIINPNTNLEDVLLNDVPNPANLEVTPIKEDKLDKKKEASSSEEEEEEEEENLDENKKSTKKATSPNAKKRHYRKSINTTVNKDVTIREEDDLEDTISADPTKNLTKRAKTMVSLLNKSFAKYDNVGFFEMIKRNGRKNVVQKFYSLLVLSKYEIIEVTQEDQYDDIIISKGDKFETFSN